VIQSVSPSYEIVIQVGETLRCPGLRSWRSDINIGVTRPKYFPCDLQNLEEKP